MRARKTQLLKKRSEFREKSDVALDTRRWNDLRTAWPSYAYEFPKNETTQRVGEGKTNTGRVSACLSPSLTLRAPSTLAISSPVAQFPFPGWFHNLLCLAMTRSRFTYYLHELVRWNVRYIRWKEETQPGNAQMPFFSPEYFFFFFLRTHILVFFFNQRVGYEVWDVFASSLFQVLVPSFSVAP